MDNPVSCDPDENNYPEEPASVKPRTFILPARLVFHECKAAGFTARACVVPALKYQKTGERDPTPWALEIEVAKQSLKTKIDIHEPFLLSREEWRIIAEHDRSEPRAPDGPIKLAPKGYVLTRGEPASWGVTAGWGVTITCEIPTDVLQPVLIAALAYAEHLGLRFRDE